MSEKRTTPGSARASGLRTALAAAAGTAVVASGVSADQPAETREETASAALGVANSHAHQRAEVLGGAVGDLIEEQAAAGNSAPLENLRERATPLLPPPSSDSPQTLSQFSLRNANAGHHAANTSGTAAAELALALGTTGGRIGASPEPGGSPDRFREEQRSAANVWLKGRNLPQVPPQPAAEDLGWSGNFIPGSIHNPSDTPSAAWAGAVSATMADSIERVEAAEDVVVSTITLVNGDGDLLPGGAAALDSINQARSDYPVPGPTEVRSHVGAVQGLQDSEHLLTGREHASAEERPALHTPGPSAGQRQRSERGTGAARAARRSPSSTHPRTPRGRS